MGTSGNQRTTQSISYVSSSIGASGARETRGCALAQAAEPSFGFWGVGISDAIAIFPTLSRLLTASTPCHGSRRCWRCRPFNVPVPHQSMSVTAGLALVVTAFLELS